MKDNILTIAMDSTEQLTTEDSIVSKIITEYEYSEVIAQIDTLTKEMAIAEKASVIMHDYEYGLTTENSQSRLEVLYRDLNLRQDQIEQLTTEGAEDIINKIKEIIKKNMGCC